jgi:CRP-like cAMP-binding protein
MQQTPHKNRLLGGIPEADMAQYFSRLDPVVLAFRDVIYEVGAPLDHVYFIEEGIASILTNMRNGESVEAGMIGSEGVVGLPALLGRNVSGHHLLVQAPVIALRMSVADCREAFNQSASVRGVLLRYTGQLLDIASQTAACNRLHSLQQRCCRWVLMMHDRLQSDNMPLTHDFLASMLGVRRPRVTEAAGALQGAGIIRYFRGQLTILDHQALLAAACECYREHDRFPQ